MCVKEEKWIVVRREREREKSIKIKKQPNDNQNNQNDQKKEKRDKKCDFWSVFLHLKQRRSQLHVRETSASNLEV